MQQVTRRALLAGMTTLLVAGPETRASIVQGGRPWHPYAGGPPEP